MLRKKNNKKKGDQLIAFFTAPSIRAHRCLDCHGVSNIAE